MNRGARRGPIFSRDEHCLLFLDVLGSVSEELGWEVHAWALMPNHFHLLVRSVHGNLSRCMQLLASRYTLRLNAAEGWDGPSFRGRFRSQRVLEPEYLRHLVAYIHLNPVRAHLAARPDEDCWTSHRAHLGLETAPGWLASSMVAEQFGTPEQLQAYARELHSGAAEWPEELDLATGWFYQAPAARRQFKLSPAQLDAPPPLVDADAVLARVCELTATTLDELSTARRGAGANPARRFAAWMLAALTTLSRREIAARLQMQPRQVEALLYRLRKHGPGEPLRSWRLRWDEAPPPAGEAAARAD